MEQNKVMKGCILLVITLCLLGCNKDDLGPTIDRTVHLAGFLGILDGGAVAAYWKDGVYSCLPNDSTNSNVHSLYVNGSSVLVGGWKRASNAVIWRDGTEAIIDGSFGGTTLVASRDNNLFAVWNDLAEGPVFLKNGVIQPIIDTAWNIGPNGLALLDQDMYVSGSSTYHDGQPDSKIYQHAQCWKNGQLIFRENEISNAMSIFIHKNDIYMAGYFDNPAFPGNNACYWKNGTRVDLTGAYAAGLSIFVTDSHVYVSGIIDNQAVYWKDGEMTVLTTPGPYSAANSIFVKGTDVHVAGVEKGYPAYWKNDVRQDIQHQDKVGQIKFVVVGSN